MDFTIRNAAQTLDNKLLAKAKELSKNTERTSGGSITPGEVTQLLETAKSDDGIVSEEEVRFIAGLTSEENVSQLAKSNFQPTHNELRFSNVSRPRLQSIRQQVEGLSTKMSSVERAIRQKPYVMNLMDSANDPSLSQKDRLGLMHSFLDEQGSLYNLGSATVLTDVIGIGSLKSASNTLFGTSPPSTKGLTAHQTRMQTPGLYAPLFRASSKEPMMNILDNLTASVINGKTRTPQELLRNAMAFSRANHSTNPRRDAITAIAAIMGAVHTAGKAEEGVNDKHNKVLKQMGKAYTLLNDYKTEAKTVLMNHELIARVDETKSPGVDYISDNNLHFWSHAYVSFSLMDEGYTAEQAEQVSNTLGTRYEMINIGEHQGNSGIKDMIINAYGAEFGIQFFNDAKTRLPEVHEGPPVENKRDF